MKIALLLSGGLGDDINSYNSIQQNIIQKYNPDIFFAYGFDSITISENELVNNWKPTKYYYGKFPAIIEPNIKSLEKYSKQPETNIESLEKMWWGIYTANQLKCKYEEENGFKYDFVIRCRPDLVIHTPLELKGNDIYIPMGWDHRGGINDTFAFGPSDAINHYCNLYNKLHQFASNYFTIHPESLLKAHLDRTQYGIMRWTYPITLRDMQLDKLEYRQK